MDAWIIDWYIWLSKAAVNYEDEPAHLRASVREELENGLDYRDGWFFELWFVHFQFLCFLFPILKVEAHFLQKWADLFKD